MADTFITEILKDGSRRIDILGRSITYSTGDSLEVKSRYSHDGTGQSQALTRRVRNTALTATIRWETNHLSTGDISLFDYIAEIEGLCGRQIELTFNGRTYPKFIVRNVGVSCTTDAVDIFSSVALSMELVEGYVRREMPSTKVGTLKKGAEIA